MKKKKLKRTQRGFRLYGEFKDSRGCRITVQESSAVGRHHAYVYCHNDGAYESTEEYAPAHLSVKGVQQLIKALQEFLDDAKDPKNWRNTDQYKKDFG